MKTLYDELKAYADSDYYGFHMPGHKRNRDVTGAELPYEIDITEIEGFDDLHHAGGILKQAQERAAKVFHAEESLLSGQWKYGGDTECNPWVYTEGRSDSCGTELP